jgi:hypothetical protein
MVLLPLPLAPVTTKSGNAGSHDSSPQRGQRSRCAPESASRAVSAVLAPAGQAVLVHGDLHGDNQVWDRDELRLVVDLETVGAAEPEYDLRALPGPAMGPRVELLTAVMRHYRQFSGRQLSPDRVMAWHLRAALGDALWRSEAGIPLADHRTPPDWVDDLFARFRMLGINPEAPAALRADEGSRDGH